MMNWSAPTRTLYHLSLPWEGEVSGQAADTWLLQSISSMSWVGWEDRVIESRYRQELVIGFLLGSIPVWAESSQTWGGEWSLCLHHELQIGWVHGKCFCIWMNTQSAGQRVLMLKWPHKHPDTLTVDFTHWPMFLLEHLYLAATLGGQAAFRRVKGRHMSDNWLQEFFLLHLSPWSIAQSHSSQEVQHPSNPDFSALCLPRWGRLHYSLPNKAFLAGKLSDL